MRDSKTYHCARTKLNNRQLQKLLRSVIGNSGSANLQMEFKGTLTIRTSGKSTKAEGAGKKGPQKKLRVWKRNKNEFADFARERIKELGQDIKDEKDVVSTLFQKYQFPGFPDWTAEKAYAVFRKRKQTFTRSA